MSETKRVSKLYRTGATESDLIILDGVTDIRDCRFQNRRNTLTSITIPGSVTSIGNCAFDCCKSLTNVTFGENSRLTSIGAWAFRYCEKLKSIVIPDSVTDIGAEAFLGCAGLTNVVFGKGVSTTGVGTFYGCLALRSIGPVGSGASVEIPDNITGIHHKSFSECEGLTSVTLPDSVTHVGRCAFSDCARLTSVTLPGGLIMIGVSAFYGCTNLTDITFQGTMEQWNTISKGNNWNHEVPAAEVKCTDGKIKIAKEDA